MLKIANLKEGPVNFKDPESISKWADLSKIIATSIGETARELGMSADEFSKSDVGKITMFMIALKIMGRANGHCSISWGSSHVYMILTS